MRARVGPGCVVTVDSHDLPPLCALLHSARAFVAVARNREIFHAPEIDGSLFIDQKSG